MLDLFTGLKAKWFLLTIIVCFSFSDIALAQRKKSKILKHDMTLRDGQVVVADGTVLHGQVVFNDNEGIVTLINDDESKSFNSRDVVKFEFYHDELARYKVFYSLEYNDVDTGMKDYAFFEVFKELDSFAVLIKIDRINTKVRKVSTPVMRGTFASSIDNRNSKKITQTQTIFFMSDKGDLEPYVKITENEIQGILLDLREKNAQDINAGLFKKYTAKHYDELMRYARENNLGYRNKVDLIRLLDEYERLIKK